MAEYCRECAAKILGLDVKHAIMSKELDLCEGCGEYKPVVVRIGYPSILDSISSWLYRKSKSQNSEKNQKAP